MPSCPLCYRFIFVCLYFIPKRVSFSASSLFSFFPTQSISDSQLASPARLFFGPPLRLGGGRDAGGEKREPRMEEEARN